MSGSYDRGIGDPALMKVVAYSHKARVLENCRSDAHFLATLLVQARNPESLITGRFVFDPMTCVRAYAR